MGKRPPGTRCLECNELITVQRYRLHPECSKLRRNRRKRERRAGETRPVTLIECQACGQSTERFCKTQLTCQASSCKKALQKIRDQRRDDRGPTLSPTVVCEVCGDEVPRRSPTHVMCDKKECHSARSAFLQRENRRIRAARRWKPCPVCDDVVKDTLKTYHPACRRQLKNDKRRLARVRGEALVEKAEAVARRRLNQKTRGVPFTRTPMRVSCS